ncbi:hypothetical protein F4821DRAFT_257793 [Hypoxylon rubiginosum]|uniref:Uncharacterized protein n=1 Tax=Hypoxylon rubiginosum TaxID=110542 RepID=A0ACC0D7S0_9PEZI|nr:hypothetical protein F4821DRAFT_257793 [Hypoxylon rubiginosum]
MSSLFEQAAAMSTDKPILTKYGHATPGESSGVGPKSTTLSAGKPRGGQKTETSSQQAKAAEMARPEVQTPTPSMKKVKSGIEYFQP